jgi:hypothetical protein
VKFGFTPLGCPIFQPSTLSPPSTPPPPPSMLRHRHRLPRHHAVSITNPIPGRPCLQPRRRRRCPRPRCTVPDFFSNPVTLYRLHEVRDPPTFLAAVSGIEIRHCLSRTCKAGRPASSISPASSLEARHAWWYSSSRPERIEATPVLLSSVRITSSVCFSKSQSCVTQPQFDLQCELSCHRGKP